MLFQLSYTPGLNQRSELESHEVVGLGRFELPTSPLSGVRSSQLSYRPDGRVDDEAGSAGARGPVGGPMFAQN